MARATDVREMSRQRPVRSPDVGGSHRGCADGPLLCPAPVRPGEQYRMMMMMMMVMMMMNYLQ